MDNTHSSKLWSPILQGVLISLAMGIGTYVFLGLFTGIASSTRWIASLAFLAFGFLATLLIGVNVYLSRKRNRDKNGQHAT